MFEKWKKATAPPAHTGGPEFLVVGLGNPGAQYEMTRHNAGFLAVDLLAMEERQEISRLKFKALLGEASLAGHRCLLMKPQTFMNNSGEAVRDAAAFYRIGPERVIVLFDDISLEPGRLRVRRKGSDGGHNGVKSILCHLNSDQFPRVKIGVGAKPHPDFDLADWVLSSFRTEEQPKLKDALECAGEAVRLIVDGKIDEAMNRYNA